MNWVIHEKKMAEALEQDKDHVNKLNARFRRVSELSWSAFGETIWYSMTRATQAIRGQVRSISSSRSRMDRTTWRVCLYCLTTASKIIVLIAISLDQTEETTTLHAILWKRAQNEPTLLQACYFEQDGASGERERIGYHRQVKDIRGTGSERTLYLVTVSDNFWYHCQVQFPLTNVICRCNGMVTIYLYWNSIWHIAHSFGIRYVHTILSLLHTWLPLCAQLPLKRLPSTVLSL